ncbi:MAG: 50S ribosomal protein L21e, partial [Asgard group archaeon]|nr:50S ribosomal protein L21e [Asgard group archaeon]
LVKYKVGDQVVIKIDPAIQKGMPHRRYHGKFGVISEVRGRSYVIKIKTGNAVKQIIARPEHVYLAK